LKLTDMIRQTTPTKTVIIVEDNEGLRRQLLRILESAPDIQCAGAFVSAEVALPEILEQKPDVVLMDIKLPGMSGIQCVAEIKKAIPNTQVIMVTVYEDSERIFRALKAGANGYLIKSSPPEQLLESIRDVYKGGAPMSSHIARKVVQHFHLLGPSVQESENLSPREQEVLDLLAMGFIYKEIGVKLNIGAETVRTYVKNICQKMHVRSRLEAVAKHRSGAQ
jgi:DNA-binding NarL/FixJ family response regulator